MAGHYTGRIGPIGERNDVAIALTNIALADGAPMIHAVSAGSWVAKHMEQFDYDAGLMAEEVCRRAHGHRNLHVVRN